MKNIDVKELLERGAYFGHKVSRTNPKVLSYVYKPQNGIYLIDLFKTKQSIEDAMNQLQQIGKLGETLLVVGTKRVVKNYIEEKCMELEIPYISEKWVGGFFTNFAEIKKNIEKTNKYIEEKNNGKWDVMLKHERSVLERELSKLLRVYKGVLTLTDVPENILVIDTKKEKNVINETIKENQYKDYDNSKKTKIFAILDTNADPTEVDYPIVMNDDSSAALTYVLEALFDAYKPTKVKKDSVEEKEPKEKKKIVKKVKTSKVTKNKKDDKNTKNKGTKK
jgi:small subunit ribosomal protein S2